MYLFMLGIRISSIWNEKARQWISGRKNWKSSIDKIPPKSGRRIWFHVASLGEFEQTKPVIERLKREEQIEIILTFFSPSGYNQNLSDSKTIVTYLPHDLPGYADYFISSIQPDMAVFVKYDLWPGYLKSLADHSIPAILISANWSPVGKLSSWSIPLTKKYLKNFKRIFFQREEHIPFFQLKGFKNIVKAGDTRIDRSMNLPLEKEQRLPEKIAMAPQFDLVAGSTWPADERMIIPVIEKLNLRTVIAPHDVSPANIKRLTKEFTVPFKLYSELHDSSIHENVLIIDTVGLLSVLYSVGSIAYVGGGFGNSIHNTLEPAAHSKPIVFGPHFTTFPEAVDMIGLECAWSVKNKEKFQEVLEKLSEEGVGKEAGEKAFEYLSGKAGATEIVTRYILESIPYSPR